MIDDVSGRLLLVVCLLAAASLWFATRRRNDGRFTDSTDSHFADSTERADASSTITAHDIGRPLGTRATFVQFSTATCAACPQVRRVLSDLSARSDGVAHVEIAADERMDLVRRFGVHRTPTVLLVGPDGVVWSRAAGPMNARQAADALDAHLVPGDAHV
jgi:thioredoxin-like negative regulator of GroEL